MKQYDVSVVIPVYNSEEYIEECIKSIREQDYPNLDNIQIILINDGSTDNSLGICKKVQLTMPELNIEIITGENQGVSAARNKGIKASKGKYIMFLDSDDFISRNAISKLVEFFDENYEEIDVVSYPRYEYNENTNKKKLLQRYKDYFVETKVYDLKKNYENIEPTLNVMIKNLYEDNILFDPKMFFHEDTLFLTQVIMRKQKIGYMNEAEYFYRIYGNSTTNYKENPLYSFEQYMFVYEFLFNKYKDENEKIPKYIQRLFLNVIRYRIIKDQLWPYHLEGEDWNNACNRLISLIKRVDNRTIIQYKQMDRYHKAYLISLKDDNNINISKSYDGSAYSINDKNRIVFDENKVTVVLNRFKLKKDNLYVLGYLKSILWRYKTPELWLIYKDMDGELHKQKINITEKTITNKYKAEMDVAKFYKFEFELNVYQIKTFQLKVIIEEREFPLEYFFNKFVPFNVQLQNYKAYFGDYRIQYKPKKNAFYILKPDNKLRKKDIRRSIIRYLSINKKITLYRTIALLLRNNKKKIWLYYDRNNIFDNGYTQFKHDIKIKDNIKKYYILDGNIKKYKDKFTKRERRNVIKFGSYKHKLLFLNCDKILTSFSSLQEYVPFNKKFVYYKDIIKYDLVYLQHGILHAKLLKMYGKEFTQIEKFVVSSQFEKDNLINNYGYSKKDLICVGMPRLDEEKKITEPENIIIFAPSWREYLVGKSINRRREIDKNKFKKSKYYIETINFLTNKELLEVLEKNDIKLDYKLHPIFEPYKDCFKMAKSKNVTISVGGTDLSKCKAFITDFSSFQFDFVNLVRPIIYFMPDMKEFKAGLHSYRELELKYEDAFGNLCLTGEELVKEITKVINNNFEAEPIYKDRMEKFFFKVKHRKDRLYDILKED